MAPKTQTMQPMASAYHSHPLACAAAANSSTCAPRMARYSGLSGTRSTARPTTSWATEATV